MLYCDNSLCFQIIYSHSPVVTALQRADVTRYLEFRFVSRLLAYIGNNQCTQQSGTVSNNADNQPSSTNFTGHVVKVSDYEFSVYFCYFIV